MGIRNFLALIFILSTLLIISNARLHFQNSSKAHKTCSIKNGVTDKTSLSHCYTITEAAGNKCTDNCGCDGNRNCFGGKKCSGEARDVYQGRECKGLNPDCRHPCFQVKEKSNGKCANHCECDGVRLCHSTGKCVYPMGIFAARSQEEENDCKARNAFYR